MIGAEPGWATGPLHAPLPRRVAAPRAPVRTLARVARLLVLAHQIRQRIDDGSWANASEAATELGISRNRMSQVLALTFLAPDIQLELLSLEAVDGVEPPITEKWLFEKVARLLPWDEQQVAFTVARGSEPPRARLMTENRSRSPITEIGIRPRA
jgi:hypothetical protein